MIESIMFWNEPNNLSHWDFEIDNGWKEYAAMTALAAETVRKLRPDLSLVLGGISPVDPDFIRLLSGYELLNKLDAIAVHGFPLDWNHWSISDWPLKIKEIEAVTDLPVWVTEVGASSFGAEEVQTFGLLRTAQLLSERLDRVYWYSLFDLPASWETTTRHKESEGSAYYRDFYMGLVRADGTPKPAMDFFDARMGICQWLHFRDPRLEDMVRWLNKLGVNRVRTGISWADWHRPDAIDWFDTQMNALAPFETAITLCFTPPSRGKKACHTSPPVDIGEFAAFAAEVVNRYVPAKSEELLIVAELRR